MRTITANHDRPAVADRCIGGMSGLGAFFLGTGGARSVLSLWTDRASIDALEGSPLYRETVARFRATGVLREPQTVELFEVTGGTVSALDLAAELNRVFARGRR